MERHKIIRDFFLIVILVTFLSPPAACAESKQALPLKIGFILPLSGDWAFLGNGIRDGALLAEADLHAAGLSVQLVFEDGRGDVATSAVVASRLIDKDKVDALVSVVSGVGKIIGPMASRAKVIHIGICSDTEVADGEYNFINYLTAEQGVAKFIQYFSEVFGAKSSVGVFALNEAGFQRIVSELKQRGPGEGVDVRFVETFDKGATDFRPLLLRALRTKSDSLLILGASPEIELIAKQVRLLGRKIPLVSIEGFGLASDKTPFEGAWFIDSSVPSTQFRERFSKTYGREVTPGVGHSYDSVMLLAKAFEPADTKPGDEYKPEAVKIFRHLTDITGVVGKISVRPDGVIWSDASVRMIKNGSSVIVAP